MAQIHRVVLLIGARAHTNAAQAQNSTAQHKESYDEHILFPNAKRRVKNKNYTHKRIQSQMRVPTAHKQINHANEQWAIVTLNHPSIHPSALVTVTDVKVRLYYVDVSMCSMFHAFYHCVLT